MTTPHQTRAHTPLLTAGIVDGPLFIVVALAQALTRDGYDLTKHPTSLLSNGDLGWTQIANFVVTGALLAACGVGIRRALTTGAACGSRLYVIYGVALIGAGVQCNQMGETR